MSWCPCCPPWGTSPKQNTVLSRCEAKSGSQTKAATSALDAVSHDLVLTQTRVSPITNILDEIRKSQLPR